MERSMSKPFDLSKSLAALDQDSTLIVVIEMSQSSWLVAARAGAGAGSAEEAAAGSGTAVQIDRPLARGVAAGRTRGAAGLCRLRGGARRLLARAVAPPTRHRGLCHSSHEHPGEAGSPPRQDGSARYGAAGARV